MWPSPGMILSRIAIASLAFGSAGLVASSVQSQFVQCVAFFGSVVPQYGHCIVSQLICCSGGAGAAVYSIAIESRANVPRAEDFVKHSLSAAEALAAASTYLKV